MDFATTKIPHVWVVDSTPARYIAGCVSVGIGGKAARLAHELIPRWPVVFADAAACRASEGRISGINKLNRDSGKSALVGYFGLKVRKCPRMQYAALLFISPNPRTDALQVFQGNPSIRAFCNAANLFRHNMVGVSNKSFLSPSESCQNSLRGPGVLGLQTFSLSPATVTNSGNFSGISKCLPIGASGKIDKPEINSNPPYGFALAFLWNIYRNIEIPVEISINQVRLSLWKLKKLALSLSAFKGNFLEPS